MSLWSLFAALLRKCSVRAATIDEVGIVLALAAPIITTYLLSFATPTASALIVGRVGATALAAAALGNMAVNAGANSIVLGTASACDTLISQAFGAKNYARVGIITQRGIAISLMLCIPLAIMLWNTHSFFIALGQDEEVAELATNYVRYLLLGLPASFTYEILKKHVQNVGIVTPPLVANTVGLCVSAGLSALLVFGSPLGFLGAPIATSISQWTMCCIMLIYFRWHTLIHSYMPAHWLAGKASKQRLEEESESGEREGEGSDRAASSVSQLSDSSSHSTVNTTAPSTTTPAAASGDKGLLAASEQVEVDVAAVELTKPPSTNSITDTTSTSTSTSDKEGSEQEEVTRRDSASPVTLTVTPAAAGTGTGTGSGLGGGADPGTPTSAAPTAADSKDADGTDTPAAAKDNPEMGVDALLDATWPGFSSAAFSGWAEYLKLGLPSALMLAVEWGAFEACAIIAGLVDTPTLASHTIMATTVSMAFMPVLGISVAGSIRVGQKMGERDVEGAKRVFRVVAGLGAAFELCNAVFMSAIRLQWGHVFTDDPEVIAKLADSMYILSLYVIGDGGQCIVSGIMRGLGRPGIAASANVIAYLALGLPISYALAINQGMGLSGIWWGFTVAVSLALLALSIGSKMVDWKKASDVAVKRALEGGGTTAGGH